MSFNIIPYIKDKSLRHVFYDKSVEHYRDMTVHSDGTYPEKLINERRPGESPTIHAFRKKIFQSKTKSPFNKVLNSLSKIRKAQDYMISFNAELPSNISKDETPEIYLSEKFPRYQSLDNWFWTVCFKQSIVDPNAVSLIMPANFVKEDNEYYKLYAIIFNSDRIIDYSYNEWYLLQSNEQYYFMSDGRKYKGAVFYHADKSMITRFEQINISMNFRVTEYSHTLGYVPVVHLHGLVCEDHTSSVLYESRLSPILPEFKEATREYSDMQAEVLQHIHSTMWSIEGKECKKCKGSGKVPSASGEIECEKCKGHGSFPFDPFQYFSVKTARPGETQTPTPPAGYLSKPIEIAILQDKRIEDHIYYGLSAINYEFITRSPFKSCGISLM